MKADAYTEYAEYRFNANRRKVPVWATHVILTFNLFAPAKNGVLYLDNACITAIKPTPDHKTRRCYQSAKPLTAPAG